MTGTVPKAISLAKTQHFEQAAFSGDIYVPNSAQMGFTALQVNVHGEHPRKRILEGNVRSYYVADGQGVFSVNNVVHIVAKGDLYVIQPGDEYSYSGEMTLLEFNVSPDNSFKDEVLE
ncbi:hypothetical protein KA531_03475 [Candidatus Saccharibacteria bacterium]|nr:hypothetical protein [Candidatus Saccharibacteria bacterium]